MRIDELWIKGNIVCAFVMSIILLSATSFGATFCVSNETELQDALTTAAENGEDDTIQIVQGTYNGNFTYASYKSNSLTLEGGYTSDCATRTIDPENTVLDGGGVDHVLALVTSDAEADFSVEGLTLRNGSASTASSGGGLYAKTEGDVNLTNDIFVGNAANDNGGGASIKGTNGTCNSNIFDSNNANGSGGGAYLDLKSAIVSDNTFIRNTAKYGGGGVCVRAMDGNVANNDFAENKADFYGGGGIFYLCSGTLTNNIFTGNTANECGGGTYYSHVPHCDGLILTENIFTGNTAKDGGGAYNGTFTNNIFTENIATGDGGGVYGGVLNNNTFTRNSAGENGGGAVCATSLTNNKFIENTASGNGGGAYYYSSFSSVVSNNIFMGNQAIQGGGIYLPNTDTTLQDNVFNGNQATEGGGAYFVGWGSGAGPLTNNTFNGNTAETGGGIYSQAGLGLVTNNTLYENTASSKGGGIWVRYASKNYQGNIYNNIMWNNTAPEASDLSIDNTGDDPFFPVTVNLFNNDFDQGASGTYISKPFTIDSSNLNKIDPMFVGSGNYHLSSSSPCIDTGNNDAPGLPESDKDGNPRIVNSIVDMGAYEYNPEVPTANAGPDQTVSAGAVVTLDGSQSSDPKGATLTYLWSQTGGTAVTLSDSAAVRPTFTAPEKASLLMFELRVTNPSELNNTDGVNITVNQTIPSVTTTEVSDITSSTGSSGGNVTSEGGSSVTARGVCWSTSANPTLSDSHTSDGSGTGAFTSSLTGLNPGTTYHVRAYATNASGTAYGSDKSFMTNVSAPTVNTGTATSVTSNSAALNGTVNPNGASTTYYFEYGTTTAYGSKTVTTSAGSGTTEVAVAADITGLTAETTYHFRLVATNSEGAASGNDRTFITSTTPPLAPSVTTGSAAYLTSTSVILYGQVNPNGSDTEAYFEYGPTTDYGFVTPAEDIGSGSKSVSISATVTDLTSGAAYHYRLVATNSGGTSLGADKLLYQDLLYVSSNGTCGGKTPCFSTVQGAIDFAPSCALIRICEGAFDEDVVVDHTYGFVLSGGWDSTFAVQESETVIHSLTIGETGGPVETDNIMLQ